MGKIVKALKIAGDRAEIAASILFDSGAGSSLIRKDLADRLVTHFTTLKRPRVFNGVNGREALRSTHLCVVELEIDGKLLDGRFYVVGAMPREAIVGVDFMQTWEIVLDMKSETLTAGIDPGAIEIALAIDSKE